MHTDAALTHLHRDHYDAATLNRVLGQTGVVYCPEKVVEIVRSAGLRAEAVVTWETVQLGDLQLTAVPAVDWRGDEQVSWVVGDGIFKIFHGGDTIWHGSWWRIAENFVPFEFAVLPVNGVIAQYPGLAPSNLPATLTPEQAVTAARILGAAALCPAHYSQFHNPPKYCEQTDVEASLRYHAEIQKVPIHFVNDGDWLMGL